MTRTWAMVGGAIAVTGLGLAACAPTPPAPTPAPPPVSRPAPTPAPPPSVTLPSTDWRDAPISQGTWFYRADANATRALFGPSEGDVRFTMACELPAKTIRLWRSGQVAPGASMTIVTTSETRALATSPAGTATPMVAASLTARDRLIDAMVFSRGRFAVSMPGTETLYLPSWAEIARVAEDCR